ncbi:hypothetical protein MPL1032_160237 [Mesorhizobium plurifarium]|uniref:Uncharacterized protein n=1 Tax=Mesorhizobium plurifarium TaxID=69974 RepID=A0A0K2VT46_MESPL|nr:hypothetical protein MPL1032_160237 [Mesorhizobium plurifarium]
MVAFIAQNAAGAGIDVNDPAPAIGCNHLESIDPLASGADEVDRNDLTGSSGADNGHDIGKALDFATLIEVARPIVVIVVVLRPDGQRRGQHKCGRPQDGQAHQSGFHGGELSHAEAVKPLSIIVSRRQGARLYQGPPRPITGAQRRI